MADQYPKKPLFSPPPGSCDCHAHIFGPEKYPYATNRSYTPPDALLSSYTSLLTTLGIDRAVIVQPSVYGTDNRATLDAVQKGGKNFRGVVVIDENITSSELAQMHDIGVRGVRFNLLFKGGITLSAVHHVAEKIKNLGWHIQFLVDVSSFPDLDVLQKLPVDLVFDHMGHLDTRKGVNNPGFITMLKMLESGKAWVKLSAPYRLSCTGYPYQDITPFIKAILKTNPEKAVWATDWPHPAIRTPLPNDGDLLNLLVDWVPQQEVRQAVLVNNPSKLYGF
ncbi:MAG: amidohydrolase family protein [Desulfobulbaceae bacterium]|nr:amidohydrolase family protein [Desulfobulbaceae bacterium]